MKKITTYNTGDANIMEVVLGSVTNILTGVPSTRTQQLIQLGIGAGIGVGVSALVFARKDKHSWFNKLTDRAVAREQERIKYQDFARKQGSADFLAEAKDTNTADEFRM